MNKKEGILTRFERSRGRIGDFFHEWFADNDSVLGVEIGVDKGENAEDMLRKISQLDLIAVDLWEKHHIYNLEYFRTPGKLPKQMRDIGFAKKRHSEAERRLKKYCEVGRCCIECNSSFTVANSIDMGIIDFVYIDAEHTYSAVLLDICLWYPMLRNGGILCGHDYNKEIYPGVANAVEEFSNHYGKVYKSKAVYGEWVHIKEV